jgi:spermidine synthase
VLLLFAVTLFVSAFLLFLVQPMVGKMILPKLGGTPQVWNTCMVFFQAALLAGYAYTHSVSTYLPTRRQLLLQGGLLAVPFLFLPFAVSESWQPPTESNPVFAVLALLALLVGIPFFVVATSAPLLQKWFAATGHPASKDPYFLYGASNLGSMLALLAYPALIEPWLPVASQSWFWAAAYLLFLALALACAAVVWRAPPLAALPGGGAAPAPSEAPPPAPAAPPSTAFRTPRKGGKGRVVVQAAAPARPAARPAAPAEVTPLRRLRWIGLAAAPSSLMLGVTTYLTTDIAAVPFLWIVPLALYLLSFILVFMRWPVEWVRTPHIVVLVLQPLSLCVLVVFNLVDVRPPQWLSFAVHLLAFFLTALLCHGELARDRPSTRHLTEFYLCMSIGGVLGGLLNGLVAPMVFDRHVEYMLVLALSCLLRPPVSVLAALRGDAARRPAESTKEDYGLDVGYAVCLGLLTFALVKIAVAHNLWADVTLTLRDGRPYKLTGSFWSFLVQQLYGLGMGLGRAEAVSAWLNTIIVAGIPLVICLVFSARPLRFGLCALAFFLANGLYVVGLPFLGLAGHDESLFVHRNFFGVIRVQPEFAEDPETGKRKIIQHVLIHGGIDHGRQYISGPKRAEPISYFFPTGPIGQVFTVFKEQKEKAPYAVVGLGIGTLAAYSRPGQVVHFYEIDPAVKRLSLPPEGETPWFFYLQDALNKGVKLDVILGDGRLKLKEAPREYYQIIVLDAFSSDAIPVHLLTLEAVDMYLSKLAEGGVLIFNITNRYVDLKQPLANVAAKLGLRCFHGGDYSDRDNPDKFGADWMVMVKPRSAAAVAAEAKELARARALRLLGAGPVAPGLAAVPWTALVEGTATDLPPWLRPLDLPENWKEWRPNQDPVWTDDYSNLLSVLSL